MLEEAISYPTRGEEARKSFVVGTLLSLLSVLVVPGLVVFGYLIRVMRTPSGEEGPDAEAASYDDWPTLLVDGLKAAVVTLGYVLVPAVIALVAVAAFVVPVATFTVVEGAAEGSGFEVDPAPVTTGGVDAVGALVLVVGLVLVFVAALIALAAVYVLPAGLAHFAATGRMGSAFAVRRFWGVLTSGTYLVAWLLALVVSAVAGFVVGVVSLVPLAGFVLVPAVVYYANVVAFRLYGTAYAEATPVEFGSEPPTGQPAGSAR